MKSSNMKSYRKNGAVHSLIRRTDTDNDDIKLLNQEQELGRQIPEVRHRLYRYINEDLFNFRDKSFREENISVFLKERLNRKLNYDWQMHIPLRWECRGNPTSLYSTLNESL